MSNDSNDITGIIFRMKWKANDMSNEVKQHYSRSVTAVYGVVNADL